MMKKYSPVEVKEINILLSDLYKENPKYFPNGLSLENYNGENDTFIPIKKDNKIIGFKAIQTRDGNNYLSIGLNKDYRGKGIALKEMKTLLKAFPNGSKFVWTVQKNNIPSNNLVNKLKKNGFDIEIKKFSSVRPKGLLIPGNIDLSSRPRVKNKDGSISTIRSIGVNFDGLEYNIPTVSDEGKLLSEKEAIQLFRRTGKHLGAFDSVENAINYAKLLHKIEQEKLNKLVEN